MGSFPIRRSSSKRRDDHGGQLGTRFGSGTKNNVWDPSFDFGSHNKLHNWLKPHATRFRNAEVDTLRGDAEGY
ncbi:hypothetical protein ACSQ67_008929 [Phaseolus vulgaris]